MKITPDDIRSKHFPVRFRGFDVDEVYAFMEMLYEEIRTLANENVDLKEQLVNVEHTLREYKLMESDLRRTLEITREITDNSKLNASKEAELIIREAQLEAGNILNEADTHVAQIKEELCECRGIELHYKEEIQRLVRSHHSMLEFDLERENE